MPFLRTWKLVAALLAAGCCASTLRAQTDVPTIETIQERIRTLEEAGVEDGAKELYAQAVQALQHADASRAKVREYQADIQDAGTLLATLREELASPAEEAKLPAGHGLALAELQTLWDQAKAELAASRAKVDELRGVSELRTRRKSEIPEGITTAQEARAAAMEALAGLAPGGENEARRALLLAQSEEQTQVIAALKAERDSYEARRELLPLRRDRAQRRQAAAERAVAHWASRLDTRREEEGKSAALEAEAQLENIAVRYPPLEGLAKRTRELTLMRTGEEGLPRRISRAQSSLEETRSLLDQVDARFEAAGKRIKAGGLTEGMGLILRKDYEWLPKPAELAKRAETRHAMLSQAQLELIALQEERAAIGDPSTAAAGFLAELGEENPSEELKNEATQLLTARRDAQDAVIGELSTLTVTFYDHEARWNELVDRTRAYRDFVEKRILWVRSSPPDPVESLFAVPIHAAEITDSIDLPGIASDLEAAAAESWGTCTFLALFLTLITALRGFLRRKREEMAQNVRSFRTDAYLYTVRALVQTLLLALPVPLIAGTLGWLLSSSANDLTSAAGEGLREVAWLWLAVRFLRTVAAEKGVGAHFRWPQAATATLRKELRWYEPFGVGLGFVTLTLDAQSVPAWSDSIGRLSFIASMLVLATAVHRLLRSESDFWSISPQTEKSLLARTQRVWSLFATGLPIAFAILAAAGYYYTALQFELRLRYSFAFAFALVLVNAMLLRWLFMTRRRLAVSQALEAKARREQEGEEGEAATESGSAALDADKVDIPAVDAQTRQLFQSSITLATVIGLYFIWASVLPALRGLDRVQLLPSLEIVAVEDSGLAAGPSRAAAGESAPSSRPEIPGLPSENTKTPTESEADTVELGLPVTFTLADLLLALVFLTLTSVAAKNLPALLELALLQRLPLDGGARYAVSTIVRYLILLIGLSAISTAIGIGWHQVQWLAAALTFGLAFGLQEIFANFVSGIIILLERPVRVGDIVTVGETEGRVTQLRMRATTIQDWDRREFLIPNKEFITGSVINWTLSDPITRIIITVGVAYGSDTERARKLLLEAAKDNPLVLADPAPTAIFRSFGASSLDFDLRVFIAHRDLWPEVTDKLHSQIDRAFRDANIEIAFPQRDLHIRSAPGLEGVGRPGEDGPELKTT